MSKLSESKQTGIDCKNLVSIMAESAQIEADRIMFVKSTEVKMYPTILAIKLLGHLPFCAQKPTISTTSLTF